MSYVLRLLRLLGIVVWVGGLVFFAFVEAPTAFHVMGTTQQFALLIEGSISTLNWVGDAAGFVYLLATMLLWMGSTTRWRKPLLAEMGLVAAMVVATLCVQRGIVPAMERDRVAVGGDITAVVETNPVRVDFDERHALSEKVEGAALFLGLGVVALMAFEETIGRGAESA